VEKWIVGLMDKWILPLPLFVAGVSADHPDDAFAPDDLAVFTKFFN